MADNQSMIAGLFTTPQEYQQQQQAQNLALGARMAEMTPSQQGIANIYAGARGLGQAVGGALGAPDEQLQLISNRQSILRGLDQTDPNSIMQAVQRANQSGDQALAMTLIPMADQATQRLIQQQATRQQLAAQQVAAGAYQPPVFDDIKGNQPATYDLGRVAPQLMALGAPGVALLKSYHEAQKALLPETITAKEGEIIYQKTPEGFTPIAGAPKIERLTGDAANASLLLFGTNDPNKINKIPNAAKAIEQKVTELAQAKRTQVNVTAAINTAQQKGFGENLIKGITDDIDAGRAASNVMPDVQSMKSLIEGGVKTGFGQPTMLELNKAAQIFDPNFKASQVAGQEAFQAISNQVILPMVKKLGANPTDADLKFIVSASPNLSKSPTGNVLLLDALELKLQREQEKAKFMNDWVAQNEKLAVDSPTKAFTKRNSDFEAYTQASPLYGPATQALRLRYSQLISNPNQRQPGPARSTLQQGGLINP
jgi:hypothetical protein